MRTPVVLICAVTLAALVGCTPVATDVASPPSGTPTESVVTPQPTTSPSPDPAVSFIVPTSCEAMVGPELGAEFSAAGIALFSGTGGEGIYYPIDSNQSGGDPFSCWYGKDGVDLSTFELAAQLVDQAEHEGIVAVLGGGGFDETIDGDVVTWVQVGDEGTNPAIVHVVRPDSWLTAYSTFGGDDRVTLMLSYLDLVAEQLYS